MRLIDADALKANCDIMVGDTTIGRRDYVMFHEIDTAPSIDIVRCGKCKYKRINEDGETRYYYCALEDRPNRQWSVDDTDYCSWGEVRDE